MKRWGLVGFFILLFAACTFIPSRPEPVKPISPLLVEQSLSPLTSLTQLAALPKLPPGLVYIPTEVKASALNLQTFLPLVVKPQGPPAPCGMNDTAYALALLFMNDPKQQRKNIVCDARLVKAAQHRADDMQNRRYFGHIDPDGRYPNYWARQSGCNLPDYYPDTGNQIESIALNYPSVDLAWQAWLNSPGHRVHVLGEDPFYAEQHVYGVGYSKGDYGILYVLLTSPKC